MKTFIFYLIIMGFSILTYSQEVETLDSTLVEIIQVNNVKRYKIKNVDHKRNIPYPEEPRNSFVDESGLHSDISNILEQSFSEKRKEELRGKTFGLSFIINSKNGKIRSIEILTSDRSGINLSKKECITIIQNLKKDLIFDVNIEYKDWGELSFFMRSKF